MEHTPGPWKYVPHDTLPGGTIVAPNNRHDDGLSEIVAHLLYKNCEANAQLIAAAPELLEAAKHAEEQLAFIRRAHVDNELLILAHTELKAAIAKAPKRRNHN